MFNTDGHAYTNQKNRVDNLDPKLGPYSQLNWPHTVHSRLMSICVSLDFKDQMDKFELYPDEYRGNDEDEHTKHESKQNKQNDTEYVWKIYIDSW